MHLPKISLKKGLFASFICITLAYVVWPLVYDHFGEGAQITRDTIRQSAIIRAECQESKLFLIVPWQLAFEDSERAGQLQIGYWFNCAGRLTNAKAKYHYRGSGWIADSITIDLPSGRQELVAKSAGAVQ